jgi:hypothetical protein
LAKVHVTATDSNGTTQVGILYADGAFTPVSFKFTHAGPVNVTAIAVDSHSAIAVNMTKAYVDQVTTIPSPAAMNLAIPTAQTQVKPDSCKTPSGQAAASGLDAQMSYKATFPVLAGAKYVVVAVTGSANVAICDPAGVAISAAGTKTVTSNKNTVFTVPTATAPYYVEVYSTAPNQAAGVVKVDVTVHYEPQP